MAMAVLLLDAATDTDSPAPPSRHGVVTCALSGCQAVKLRCPARPRRYMLSARESGETDKTSSSG